MEFLTIISVVSVSTMLFFLIKKKYTPIKYFNIRVGRMSMSICLGRVGVCYFNMGIRVGTMEICLCMEWVGNCSSSAAIIGANDDLMAQILVRLPAKTVVGFKCVSKQWLCLISSDSFTRLHVQNHGRRRAESDHSFIMSDVHGRAELFICHRTIKKLLRLSMPSPIKEEPFKYFEILQSWNGLLLISIKFLGEDRIDYFVFNPTTKHYRLLQLDGYRPLYICLMFHPSKPECYKVVMVTGLTPLMKYSVYDPATQEWSHDFEGGEPFTKGDALGFCISRALLRNLTVSSIIQGFHHFRDTTVGDFPEESIYDHYYMLDSNESMNIIQLKSFPEKNYLFFRWFTSTWEIIETRAVNFNFKNCSTGVRLLGMMAGVGTETKLKDIVFLCHVPGQLLIYKIYLGFKVRVDYRSDYFYVEDEWQFEHAHPFIHTFAPV